MAAGGSRYSRDTPRSVQCLMSLATAMGSGHDLVELARIVLRRRAGFSCWQGKARRPVHLLLDGLGPGDVAFAGPELCGRDSPLRTAV